MATIGRLAPTPSGHLHLGNVTAFAAAWLSVRSAGGRLLLRMEDIDTVRARPDIEGGIREDLRWLGLDWDEEVPRQSVRDYQPAIARLSPHTYFCRCTRAQITAAGGRYPGTCRDAGHAHGALRLRLPAGPVHFLDRRFGPRDVDPNLFGDPVLVRSDGLVSYNLAVVADDITDGVTEVVRGADLLDFTAVQIHMWRELGGREPSWLHAPLVLGADGTKLSKSHGSAEIRAIRLAGRSPRHVWETVLPWLGIEPVDEIAAAIGRFEAGAGPRGPVVVG